MIQKNKENISKIAKIFAESLFNDPLHIYYFPDQSTRMKFLVALYHYMVKTEWQNIYISGEKLESVAIINPPEQPYVAQSNFYKKIPAAIEYISTVGWKNCKRINEYYYNYGLNIKNRYTEQSQFWYIQNISVKKEYLGQKYSSIILNPVLESADKGQIPAFLETHNPKNIPIFEHFGFHVVSDEIAPYGRIRHIAMLRKPKIMSMT